MSPWNDLKSTTAHGDAPGRRLRRVIRRIARRAISWITRGRIAAGAGSGAVGLSSARRVSRTGDLGSALAGGANRSSRAGRGTRLVLRHISRQFPEALARALVKTRDPIVVGSWTDTQVTGRQRRLDRALEVSVGGRPGLLHVEWQLTMTAEIAFRVYEYNVLLSPAQGDATRPGEEPLPIESVVVLLAGREERWPAEGEYRTSRREGRFSGVRFRIVFDGSPEALAAWLAAPDAG